MANPRKFSEKIALLNQKHAQETVAFEAIMREVSDVTSRVASASSSVAASPEQPLSVKSAGASPPQSSSKHLHINLGNQFRAGGSLPNVNNNANCGSDTKESSTHTGAIHSIDLKVQTALSNLEEMQHNSMVYRSNERGRNMGVGPMRSRPMEKRHDTSPYSGVLYLSPPPPDTWRRTNSDSALHQSVNEACQSTTAIPHRRGSDAYQHTMSSSGSDNRDLQYGFIERPRSSCEIPRVPGINVHQKSQPPEQQRSLPNLTHADLLEEHSSSTPFSNNHLSVPVNCRFLHTCKGVAMENSTSTSQQDLQSYSQQPLSQPPTATSHTPAGHYIYQQQPHSPVPPQSLKTSQQQQPQSQISQQQSQHQQQQQQQQQSQQQLNSLSSYRSSQQGSPLSHCNPSASPSPTGHPGSPNLTSDSIDQNTYFVNQEQAAALQMQQDFEQFTMMDGPVPTIETYMNSPSHATSLSQSDVINVGGELSDGGAGYFSTSSQMPYQSTTTTTTTTTPQLTPQTPNTPTIILTDFSGSEDLTNSEFVKDFGSAIMGDLDSELFPSDDALRQGLDPIDVDGLQMLTDPTMVISDPSAEAHFRLDRL